MLGVILAVCGAAAAQETLLFYEGFEPVCGGDPACNPADCGQSNRGAWPWNLDWRAYDWPGNRRPVDCPDCATDPLLSAETKKWGPYKFESWPDLCAGGHVYAGYRAGRQPIWDPMWASIYHDFASPDGWVDLHLQAMYYDPASQVCECECNCDPQAPPGYERPNYQVQGWICLQTPDRTEAFALGVNTYSSWVYLSWYTRTDGWHRTAVRRRPTTGNPLWRQLEIVVHPFTAQVGDVEFFIDGARVGEGSRAAGAGAGVGVNRIRLGGDPALITQNHLTNTFEELWYDEVKLFTTPTARVCHTPPQDADGDMDVDLADFTAYQSCFNGPNNPWNPLPAPQGLCACLDADLDGDVDLNDFTAFQRCFNGPNSPPGTDCPN